MKKFLLSLVIVICFSNTSYSVSYNSDPEIFISELVNDAIKTLSDKSKSKEEKSKLIEKIALENVDIASRTLVFPAPFLPCKTTEQSGTVN